MGSGPATTLRAEAAVAGSQVAYDTNGGGYLRASAAVQPIAGPKWLRLYTRMSAVGATRPIYIVSQTQPASAQDPSLSGRGRVYVSGGPGSVRFASRFTCLLRALSASAWHASSSSGLEG